MVKGPTLNLSATFALDSSSHSRYKCSSVRMYRPSFDSYVFELNLALINFQPMTLRHELMKARLQLSKSVHNIDLHNLTFSKRNSEDESIDSKNTRGKSCKVKSILGTLLSKCLCFYIYSKLSAGKGCL